MLYNRLQWYEANCIPACFYKLLNSYAQIQNPQATCLTIMHVSCSYVFVGSGEIEELDLTEVVTGDDGVAGM